MSDVSAITISRALSRAVGKINQGRRVFTCVDGVASTSAALEVHEILFGNNEVFGTVESCLAGFVSVVQGLAQDADNLEWVYPLEVQEPSDRRGETGQVIGRYGWRAYARFAAWKIERET